MEELDSYVAEHPEEGGGRSDEKWWPVVVVIFWVGWELEKVFLGLNDILKLDLFEIFFPGHQLWRFHGTCVEVHSFIRCVSYPPRTYPMCNTVTSLHFSEAKIRLWSHMALCFR